MNKKWFYKSIWFWLIVVVLIASLCSSGDKNNKQASSNNTPAPEALPTIPLPSDEEEFIRIVSEAQAQSQSAANDMQRGGIKATRDSSLCKTFKKVKIKDWVGKVTTLSANSDGKGVLEVEISNGIKIKTWNNQFSDTFDNTLIEPNSELFKKASSLKVDQSVVFSGSFIRTDDASCFKEASLTLDGKTSEPEFIFKFSEIQPSDEFAHASAMAAPITINWDASISNNPKYSAPKGNRVFVQLDTQDKIEAIDETKLIKNEIKKWLAKKNFKIIDQRRKADVVVNILLRQNIIKGNSNNLELLMTMEAQNYGVTPVIFSTLILSTPNQSISLFKNKKTVEYVISNAFSSSPLEKIKQASASITSGKDPGCWPRIGIFYDNKKGAKISSMSTKGLAEKAGLKIGDIIFSIDGKSIPHDESPILKLDKPVPVLASRDGKSFQVQVLPVIICIDE